MKKLSRLTALLLALMMLVTSMPLGALADAVTIDVGTWNEWVSSAQQAATEQENETETVTTTTTVTGTTDVVNRPVVEASLTAHAGTETSAAQSVSLPIAGKLVLHAYSGAASYQWQVKAGSQWANIMGDTGAAITLTYAKIQNAMSGSTAQVRCVMTVDGESYVSATAQVSVDESVTYTTVETQSTLTVTAEQPVLRTRAITAADAGIMLAAETPELKEYTVVINYVFENNEVAADSYTATLAAGSNFSATVKHPIVMGYLPYVDNATETSTQIELNITNIQANVTYTVTYKPTNVDYTVIHYQQNVDNDNYTIAETETLQGLTKSTVPEVAKSYDGFYALLYEKPEIAADGSTVVEIYYDRNYYLMTFDLGDGGYGVEPIYARYGATVEIGTPTRPGYTFNGWDPAVPSSVPVDGGSYTAQWTANDTAKVTVVFWGENPNDEEYSYLGSGSVTAKVGSDYTYDDSVLDCATEAHTHTNECLDCVQDEHEHSLENNCYKLNCDKTGHTHTYECYPGATDETVNVNNVWYPSNGQVTYYDRAGNKAIYVNGTWYAYTGTTNPGYGGGTVTPDCGETEGTHTHSIAGGCYDLTCTKTEHTHDSSCYGCGKVEHTHDNDCKFNPSEKVPSNLWKKVKYETKEVLPDGTTVVNVYYDRTEFTLTFKKNNTTVKTITRKWGADIHSEFPITDEGGTIQWKVPDGCTSMKAGTRFASLDSMPAENITFTYYTSDDSVTLYYYVEALSGETVDYTHDGKNFKLYKEIDIQSGVYLTYTEEFHDITGFKQWWSDPAFDKHEQGGRTSTVYADCVLCYTRNTYAIEYYNPTTLLKTDPSVSYQMPLTTYAWTPTADQAPVQYEPGSVEFEGWYLNPECTGEKFDFTTAKMPSGPNNVNGEVALSLYAKWVPVTHTVSFYLDQAALNAGTKLSTHPDVTVSHGKKLETTPADPTNGDYTFVGWFYMDNGTEKAFDFANMPVTKDLQVYAKWSSNVLKEYVVYYKIQGTETQIADPTTGSALAGNTKTFDAKGGTDLYADYQEGYFPLVKSHSMTLDINTPDSEQKGWTEITEADGTKKIVQSCTFWYVQKDAVPYTVYYVTEELKEGDTSLGTIERDGKTYYIIAETETHNDNRKAVVTEKFKQVSGYMPDAYQKRLVVDGTDGATNEIIFYYSIDSTHAYYKITHYTQNTDGESWTEYASSQAVGDIGGTYTADQLTIDGFTYDPKVYGTVVSGELTANGLELKLYYVRNSYPYEVRYLEQGTGKQLADPKKGTDLYGKVVSESAIPITNYTAVDPKSQTLTIKIEESQTEAKLNIITFYYTENEATINYVAVGPEGCGTVNPESEKVKVLTGTATGSTATPASNVYKFVGWYDENDNLVSEEANFVPEQPGREKDENGTVTKNGQWPKTTTYYAKFEYNLTTLTIKKEGTVEPNETFIFNVTTSGKQTFRVAITGNGSKVIGGLTVGDTVIVTEDTGWSNRYTPTYQRDQSITLQPTGNEITITNTKKNDKWLYDEAVVHNNFGDKTVQ